MYNFFTDITNVHGDTVNIGGADYNHIKNVLRMNEGDTFLVSVDKKSHLCRLKAFQEGTVVAEIIKRDYLDTELPIKITLFQGLPKSDKLELIIQKTVELGVDKIVPVEMHRSIVKIEEKKKKEKTLRWQAIAESAAKQSKRTTIPEVLAPMPFKSALDLAKQYDAILIPYECANKMQGLTSALKALSSGSNIAVFIGPEGGFEENEIELALSLGAKTVSLGKRILRTETASILTVGALMLYSEINL